MAIARVLGRGQVTLPRQVRKQAGIGPGDALNIEVIGQGQLRCTLLPRLGPRQLRDRYPISVAIDEAADRQAWQASAAEHALGG